jgi:hypothetical protein
MAPGRDHDSQAERAEAAAGPGDRRAVETLASPLAGRVRDRPDTRDPRAVAALQRLAGNRATAQAVGRGRAVARATRRWLARMGYRLDKSLPTGAPTPVEDHAPDQRKWRKTDFYKFWEAEQGRPLNSSEKTTIDRGCIGITANNLEGGGNPSLVEVYDDFATAQAAVSKYNSGWYRSIPWTSKYVMFGMLFWSNQDPDPAKRRTPNAGAFKGDPVTRKVDMTGYMYRAQPGKINFDYGFWDHSTSSFWHANHKEMGPADPMIVYQSTANKFAFPFNMPDGTPRRGYQDFDRAVYGVALANNYDPTIAKALP